MKALLVSLMLIALLGVTKDPNAPGGCASQAVKKEYRNKVEREEAEKSYRWASAPLAVLTQEAKNVDDNAQALLIEPPELAPMQKARVVAIGKSIHTAHEAAGKVDVEVAVLRESNVKLNKQREDAEAAAAQARVDAENHKKQADIDAANKIKEFQIAQNRERDRGLNRLMIWGLGLGIPACVALWIYLGGTIGKVASIGLVLMIGGAIAVQAAAPAVAWGVEWVVKGATVVIIVWFAKWLVFEKRANAQLVTAGEVFQHFIPAELRPKAKQVVSAVVQDDKVEKLVDKTKGEIGPVDVPALVQEADAASPQA